MVNKALVFENRWGMMECKRRKSTSTSGATLLDAALDLLLSGLFFIPLNHSFNKVPSQLGKDMQLSRLLLLVTKVRRGQRQLQTPRRIQLSGGVSTAERRATMLMSAPNCSHTPK
jgi:hypothetical protein